VTNEAIFEAAAALYAAYVAAGRVANGQEEVWMKRCVREVKQLVDIVNAAIAD
jgi:hypothetical protein